MVRGYVGEIFNSLQGEGFYVGRRQVFVRFAGCSLNCVYCDTEYFKNFRLQTYKIETKPGSSRFRRARNPITQAEVLKHVKRLTTPDTHSVSLTGGEPLQAGDFLVGVASACKKAGLATYLETSGLSSEAMACVVPSLDFASIDVKLPEHRAVSRGSWRRLFEEELACVELALERGAKTFVKVVVLPSTTSRTIARVCKPLARSHVPLVLQPVTPSGKVRIAPSMTHVYHLAQVAAEAGVGEVAIIPQLHKLIGVR